MDAIWVAAFGLGIALLLAGVGLLVYEKFWRHRYRGPYLTTDIATRAIDETAIQTRIPAPAPPTPMKSSWQAGLAVANRFGRKRAAQPRQTPHSLARKMLWVPVGLVVCLLVVGGGFLLLTQRVVSAPPVPSGSVVIGITQFIGAPAQNQITSSFSDYLLKSAGASGADNIVVRESQKRPLNPDQAEAERVRLQADFLWWGEFGPGDILTASLTIDPGFSAGQARWRRFSDPDIGALILPVHSELLLPAGSGTDPLVPFSLALAHFRSGDFAGATHAAAGARATLEEIKATGGIARLLEATVAVASGDTAGGRSLFDALEGIGQLSFEGLVNRAVSRYYLGDVAGAISDADRVIADREATDLTRSRAYLIRARARQAQGDLFQATTDLDESMRLDPSYLRARLDKAELLYRQSQPESARAELDNLIRQAPDAAPAFRLLGLVKLMLAQPQDALATLSRASEIYGSWIAGFRQEEAHAQVTGDNIGAKAATDAIIQLNREMAAVRLYEGMALADVARTEPPETFLGAVWRNIRGEPSTSERALLKMEDAKRLDPQRPDVALQTGQIYAQMGNTEAAIRALEEAQSLDPTAPEAYFALAALYERAGLTQDAIAVLNKLLANAPRTYRAYEEMNRVYVGAGESEPAASVLRNALTIEPQSAEDYLWRGKFYRLLGDDAQAEAELRSAATDPQLVEAHLQLGQIYANTARGPQALAEFQLVLESQQNNPDALLGAGRQLALAGQTTEAGKLLSRLTTLSPGNVDGHIAYLQLLLSMGEVDKAIAEGRKAVEADNDRSDAYFYLGEALEAKMRWDDASQAYRSATQRDPTLFEAFIRLAGTLLREDKYAESREASQAAINLRPTDPQPYRWKAEAELALFDVTSALASISQAVQLRPGYAEALALGSRAYSMSGDDRTALDYASEAIKSEPQDVAGHLSLGEAHLTAGRLAEAAAAFEGALRISPTEPRALIGKGRVEDVQQRHQEALDLYSDAMESDPESAEAYLFAGHTYVQLGRWEDAFAQYRKAAEIRPRWPTALYYLGRAYLQRKDLANAHGAFLKATEYSPNYVEAWFYLGLAGRERARPQEAIAAFQKAAQLNGSYAEAWLYLGLTLEETGERTQAVEAFTRARDTSGAPEIRSQAEQGLHRVQ
jgi:tetratricopeptide (TPR) repeat protein